MSSTDSNQALRRFGSRQWICQETNTTLAYCDNDRYLISHYKSGYSNYPSHIDVFDTETGELIPEQTNFNARMYACAGDSILLASTLSLYFAKISQLNSPLTIAFEHDIAAIAVSRDGQTIAVALEDKSLFLLTPDLDVILELTTEHVVKSLHFLDGSSCAPAQLAISASTDRTHRLYLLGLEDHVLLELKGARAEMDKVVSDAERVYTCSGKNILSWPRVGGKVTLVYKADNDCRLLNKYKQTLVFSNGSKQLTAIDVETGKELWHQEKSPISPMAMHQEKIALYSYREVLLIDSESGDVIKKATCHVSACGLALSESNQRISVSSFNYVLQHWSLTQDDFIENTNPGDSIEHSQILNNGDWVTLQDGQLFFWSKDQNEAKQIITSLMSDDTFFIDEKTQRAWLADEHIQCYCLASGDLLHQVPGYFKSDCRVILPIDEERLLFISEGGRRRYGHLMVIESATGNVLHDSKIDRAFYNGAHREENLIYLASRAGDRYVFDCDDYSFTQLTGYDVQLRHGLYASHFPIQALTPKHTLMVEYGSQEDDKRPRSMMVTDVESGEEVLPLHHFSDDIMSAKILPCEKRIVMAMKPLQEAEQVKAPYVQIFDIESRETSEPVVLDIEGTERANIDYLRPLNNHQALVGFKNGTNVLVSF